MTRSERNSEQARACPNEVRHLLEVAEGPAQEQAWTDFVESYSRLILYVARQTPGDYDVVMDRYAFVVERLRETNYRRLRTYVADGRGKFTTWLTVVARRLCLDFDRMKNGRGAHTAKTDQAPMPSRLVELILDPELVENHPDDKSSPEEDFDRKRLLERLHAAIAVLSSSDQLLLALRYRDDRSAPEIASLLKLPTAFHVYRSLNRIHSSLRETMRSQLDLEQQSIRAGNDPSAVQYWWNK